MTPIRSIKNQYRGINAHLHSLWQGESGWSGFHTAQIGDLLKTLKMELRPKGYTVDIETSLQVRRIDQPPGQPRADVMIYDLDPERPFQSQVSVRSAEQVTTVAQLLDLPELSEKPYRAMVIREFEPTTMQRGEPVAWIELLSPSNKGHSADAEIYQEKRLKILASGIVFVEIDYLHETSSTFPTLPSYPPSRKQQIQSEAHPYRIVIIDPRPDFDTGPVHVEEFDVDEPIPTVEIPLNAGDVLEFDFGIPYWKTFEEAFYGDNVDYTQLPLNFDRYSKDDQMRIAARMLAVLEAARDSIDLESGPFPVKPIASLDVALEQINALAGQR